MRIDEERVGDVTILAIAGDLDARTLPEANEKLESLIKVLRVRLVINLAGIEVVTSTAVSFLIDAARRTRKLGGDAVLSNVPRLFLKTIETLEIGDFFKVFPADEEAVADFREIELQRERECGAGQEESGAPEPSARRGWPFRLRRGKSS